MGRYLVLAYYYDNNRELFNCVPMLQQGIVGLGLLANNDFEAKQKAQILWNEHPFSTESHIELNSFIIVESDGVDSFGCARVEDRWPDKLKSNWTFQQLRHCNIKA